MKHWNKVLSALLIPVLLLSLAVPALAADVQRSGQKLSVDGVEIDCEKYNIDGSNYFKLRDLAALLSGTGSAFAVGWDAERGTVSITTGQDYTKVGGELEVGADNSASAQVSAQTVVIDGKTVESLSAYNIGGNNYFKLRDLGEALGFAVYYDADANTAIVWSIVPEAREAYAAGDAAYVAEDYAAAFEQCRRAAELGYAEAQTELGYFYFYGDSVEQDYAAAVEWFRKAAEQGEPDAQSNMGYCYYNGLGVEQDHAAAVRWYRRGALQGHAVSQSALGVCYLYGDVVEQDYLTAVEWFLKAAEQKEPYAQYYLGVCYEYGLGLPVDPEAAQVWYGFAAEQGVTGIDELYSQAEKRNGFSA